ncbi:MAG: hypothetical protein CL552_06270 [Alcanivorax sp.]|jgi:phosphatidylserine/phosphatidylglycerophosphate/cardiolipin synthase-like enzyme|nr:hypothetical protein [Alcanivorax sp.]MBG32686.1 hypothetical protein [Alcanivorax sp.]
MGEGGGRHVLKAKALALHHREILVGAFNIDSRSEHLNTEISYYAASDVVGQQVDAFFEEKLIPQTAMGGHRAEKIDLGWRWS